MDRRHLAVNKAGWDKVAPGFFGATSLPAYGPMTPDENELGLFGEIEGSRVLELGCGSGHSLAFLAGRGAGELWGLDLSSTQVEAASRYLAQEGLKAHLFQSPMELNPGLPESYFDRVFSIYALGWTLDLDAVLALVHSYLRPGGSFIFSWEHPVYSCLEYHEGLFRFSRPYHDEGPVRVESWHGVPIVMHPRKLSTYINAVLQAGLVMECIVEPGLEVVPPESDGEPSPERWYSPGRARWVPTTFVMKARKPIVP